MSSRERAGEVLAQWRASHAGRPSSEAEELILRHPDLGPMLREEIHALARLEAALRDSHPVLSGSGGAPADAPPPTQIAEYRILREIGRGGMGVVYEAEQPAMRRRVALKVLYPSFAGPRGTVERFQREARAAGQLQHPNLVTVHALGEDLGVWYCAMELVEGSSLDRVIQDLARLEDARATGSPSRAPEGGASGAWTAATGGSDGFRQVARRFADVADALEVAHQRGIVHRDVKPANLMVAADGALKVLDFGLARLRDESTALTQTRGIVGTVAYMSPEQAASGGVDGRTDVWSLGATLYEVLTLRPPFPARDAPELLHRLRTEEPPRPSRLDRRIPRDLETIVLKALEKDVARRYASAASFADDLRAFVDGKAIRARRASPLSRAIRFVRRHPAQVAAVALLVLGAGTALVLARWGTGESEGRRLAEYRLLLQHALVYRPDDDDEGPSLARSLYEKAIALEPARSEAYVARALSAGPPLEDRLRDVDAAQARGESLETALLLRAYLLAGAGRDEEAANAAALAGSRAASEDPLARLVAGRRAHAARDYEAAEREYQRALERLPADAVLRHSVLVHLADLHMARGDFGKALTDLHALQAQGDDRWRLAAQEAWLWRKLGRGSEASVQAQDLADRSLGKEEAALLVATTWRNRRALDWADALTERAVVRYPKSAGLWGLRAYVCEDRYRIDQALAAWETATALDPTSGVLAARRAGCLVGAGRTEDALATSDRATHLAPKDVDVWTIRAEVLRRASRPDDAEVAARKAVSLAPRNPLARRALAGVLLAKDQVREALQILEPLRDEVPGDPDTRRAMACVAVVQARFADALAEADAGLQTAPEDADLHEVRADALRGLQRLPEAGAAYRRSLELRPRDVRILWALGNVQLQLEQFVEAAGTFRTALEVDSAKPELWNQLGNALRGQGANTEAIEAYRKALAVSPDDPDYLVNEASLLVDLGRSADALPTLDRVIRIRPDNPIDRYNRALVYSDLGRKEDAIAEFREAARLDRTDGMALMRAGGLLFELGRIDESIDTVREAISRQPKNASFHHDLAVMCLNARRLQEAERAAREAVALKPDDADSQSLVGHLLLLAGRPQDALEYVDAARRLAPGNPDYVRDCAATYMALGREGKAVDLLVDAVQRFPDHAGIRTSLAWSLVDTADESVRDANLAAVNARRATELDGGSAVAWMALGSAVYRQKRYGEAVAHLERARTLDPGRVEPAATYYLAMALAGSGKGSEARAAFDRGEGLRRQKEHDDADNRRRAREAAGVLGLPAPE